ncbi:hypothetical protein SAMN05421833_1516 [Microbispora rosea]|uniref:Uncharacterized protein n=1 Tax=Microbispora rosea TaxID=58117 RepID=A0A1N7HHL1_9ACTN|nr:hypothetical protein SAMN05421833_1516 [Microbispora rosea]
MSPCSRVAVCIRWTTTASVSLLASDLLPDVMVGAALREMGDEAVAPS